jgi:phospholipid/cholesterol/gamma-HCH transport system substrate-binding protein
MAGLNLMKSVERYKVYFNESVSGLEIGAQVKYNGVRVGQVAEIKIVSSHLNKVLVVLELESGTPVKDDTKAVLTGMGITGLKFVELTGGSEEAPLLPPGGTLKAGRSFMGIIGGKAEDIAVKTELVLNRINAVLNDTNLVNIEHVIANVREITGKVNSLIDDNDDKIAGIVDDLAIAAKDLKAGIGKADRSMAELEQMIASSRPGVEEIVRNMEQATASFRRTGRDLAKVEGILGQISATVDHFDKKLAALDVAGISSGVKTSVDEAGETLHTIRRTVEASRQNIFYSSKSLKRTLRNLEEFSSAIRDQPSLLLSNKKPKDRGAPED